MGVNVIVPVGYPLVFQSLMKSQRRVGRISPPESAHVQYDGWMDGWMSAVEADWENPESSSTSSTSPLQLELYLRLFYTETGPPTDLI